MTQLTHNLVDYLLQKHIFPTELRNPNSGQGINYYNKQSQVTVYEERAMWVQNNYLPNCIGCPPTLQQTECILL